MVGVKSSRIADARLVPETDLPSWVKEHDNL